MKIKVIGNCDVQGGADENIKLGQRRADSVKSQLVKQYGIDGSIGLYHMQFEGSDLLYILLVQNHKSGVCRSY